MSLDQFHILSIIRTDLKSEIKSVHVFDDKIGINVLFITNNDLVYGFGQNTFGCCGLGHNNVVNEPQIIPKLCHQKIKQFIIGWSMVASINFEGKLYVWGNNSLGQLGMGYKSDEYLKPNVLSNLNNKIIVQVQCGSAHSMILTNEGLIYGWGNNEFGQVGCGPSEKYILKPSKLKLFSNSKIKSIYCSFNKSFAQTVDGLVYSWGQNNLCTLGHSSAIQSYFYEPKLIDIVNVKTICFGGGQTYFLCNDGYIYFCGIYKDENNCESFEIIPRLIDSEIKFDLLHSIPWYRQRTHSPIAFNNVRVYQLYSCTLIKTKYYSLFEYYADYCGMTYETIELHYDDISEQILKVNNDNYYLDHLRKLAKIKNIKENIKYFHIFNDEMGPDVIFVTSHDNIFSFGSNFNGVCGFGHDNVINKPLILTDLCGKNIDTFSIGMGFGLALSIKNKIYAWGVNTYGQLGIGFVSSSNLNFKPKEVLFPKNEIIYQISCGSAHSLGLTSNGIIYGWGYNEYGQIGCGKEKGIIITKPTQVKSCLKFKLIFCTFNNSFAISSDSNVYSWGCNQFCCLGHEMDLNECVFEPKLIMNLSKIINICVSSVCTYFLTTEGNIYFCGQLKVENSCVFYEKLPIKLNESKLFSSLHSISDYCKREDYGLAICDDVVYKLFGNKVIETNYKNPNNYLLSEYKLSYNTVVMNEDIWYENKTIYDETQNFTEKTFSNVKNEDHFKVISELGTGAFGRVFKVLNKSEQKNYALKKIQFKESDDILKILDEVKIMANLNENFVVKYFNSWNCNKSIFIQMEFCSDRLNNIIQQKPVFFMRGESKPMNTLEYFISCQLFKELLECVQYLHESNPPIIHRDLKPENILISENSYNNRFLKLADFGLSTYTSTYEGTLVMPEIEGTLRYMAPECNNSIYSIKSDIYALSIIAQELFDYDIDSSDNKITGNEYLHRNWNKLTRQIERMSERRYRMRPNCSDLLENFNDWAIEENNLLKSLELQNYETKEEEINQDNFFKKYLNAKLNKKLYNITPDSKRRIKENLGLNKVVTGLSVLNKPNIFGLKSNNSDFKVEEGINYFIINSKNLNQNA